ncbi:MAG: hypothetical protein IIU11_08210 [Bacteroidales bacterium]|nr:hypothetical protein [Bacteroidales bacterium]
MRQEVIGMILTEFNQELYEKNVREDGYLEGQADKAIEDAENFLRENITPEIIARCTGLPLEKVQALAEKISVNA